MKKLTALYIDLQSKMQSIAGNEKGATMVEYALMLALIAVVSVGAVTIVGTDTLATFNDIATAL
jgi:pilus assembly protein Flp/PilA